jgi:hypothetical protein
MRTATRTRASKAREVDGAEATAAIRGQGLFAARVGGVDGFAVREVVVGVDAVEEQHPRLGVVVGGPHDLVPQLACGERAVDPRAVVALARAFGHLLRAGAGAVHQVKGGVVLHCLHEGIGHADRDVEVGEIAGVLRVDELLDVGVVAAQHPHLRAAPRARRFHGFAGAVEDAHVRHRAGGAGLRARNPGPARADAREVVAHAAAAAHGLGRFGERRVDAGVAFVVAGDGVAHGLHEAVDERGSELGACGGVDAPGGHEAGFERLQEARFPWRPRLIGFRLGQGARDAPPYIGDAAFVALGVLFEQHLVANGLSGQGSGRRLRVGKAHRWVPGRAESGQRSGTAPSGS